MNYTSKMMSLLGLINYIHRMQNAKNCDSTNKNQAVTLGEVHSTVSNDKLVYESKVELEKYSEYFKEV